MSEETLKVTEEKFKIGRPQKYTYEESVNKNRERVRKYNRENAEKIKEKKKKYYEEHKEEFRERYKKRYAALKETHI